MEIFNPVTEADFLARNSLLQRTMRQPDPQFSISAEYPIVLNQINNQYSWCLADRQQVVAHLNLWPRTLKTSTGAQYQVGLVGNVATETEYQGRGLMRRLIDHASDHAEATGCEALILWSDLSTFYQKIGFESVGNEFRLTIDSNCLAPSFSGKFLPTDIATLTDTDLEGLMRLRLQTGSTLTRSAAEFRELLKIPSTTLFTARDSDQGYAVLGKGYDMVGVVHEWSLSDYSNMLALLADVVQATGIAEVMLLSPLSPTSDLLSRLSPSAYVLEEHPMAMAKFLGEDRGLKMALQTGFIWGLDSI